MKKLLIVTIVVLAMALVMAGAALASGGPHGGFTATTDACAGCHRAHTAPGARLLIRDSVYELCVSCHGSAGTGANTNVEDGVYLSDRDDLPGGADGDVGAPDTPDNAPLLGGGFVFYQGVATTSAHDVDPATATDAAWGDGVDRGVTSPLVAGNLTCSSCHDPHGNDVYRIIRDPLNGAAVTAALVDEDLPTCDPVANPGDCYKDYDTEQWDAGMNSICAACHGAYHTAAAGVGSDPVEAANGGYTHRVGMPWDGDAATDPIIGMGAVNPETVGMGGFTLPLAESGANNTVVCMTCHLPHGTSVVTDGFADGGFDPAGPLGPIPSGDSALLRLENRGVCEVCHQK